jgi:proline dehydrogenase
MFRTVILAAARSARAERLAGTAPLARGMVRRFVAGENVDDALTVAGGLAAEGMSVTLDRLGEDASTPAHAEAALKEYLRLLERLSDLELTPASELSVKLSALGQLFDRELAYANAHAICASASEAGTTVTIDAEDHTTTDATLDVLARLRADFPTTGAVVQAYLRRAEADCRELAAAGSRVRLCKGAYAEPESVAFPSRLDVDRSYVRCLNVLMSGTGYPMIATHDPRLIAIAEDRATWFDRSRDQFEFQMLYGVRPDEQRRLAAAGYTMRVYLPFGADWYPYLMRRLAERPANLRLLMRALRSR